MMESQISASVSYVQLCHVAAGIYLEKDLNTLQRSYHRLSQASCNATCQKLLPNVHLTLSMHSCAQALLCTH